MKKKILTMAILEGFIGIAISTIIAIGISYCMGDGSFYAVSPELVAQYGSELSAVTLQTLLSFVVGALAGGSSYIFRIESWSLLRQTVTHCLVLSPILVIAYILKWMDNSVSGIIEYIVIFIGIYVVIWFSVYYSSKKHIKQMNKKIKNIDK